jgi:hypothetical protein
MLQGAPLGEQLDTHEPKEQTWPGPQLGQLVLPPMPHQELEST